MSNIVNVKKMMKRYSIAGIPFICFSTIEPDRALNVLRDVANELSYSFYVYQSTKGVYNISSNKLLCEDKSVYGAIDFFTEQMKRMSYLKVVFTEVPDIGMENTDSKQFLALVHLAYETGGSIIVLTDNFVWKQLLRYGMMVKLDPPNEDELYAIIKERIDEYRNEITIEWDEDDIREAASALLGVTKIEAENVITSLLANKRITKSDMNEVRFAKDKLFSDISGLEKIEVDEQLLDIEGLVGMKNWLDEKKELFKPANRDILKSKGLRPPKGILLVGVSGCGKSLSAKYISANWKLPLYRLDFATVQGQYVGQTEQQLKDALSAAERAAPCILWIDEIEKGLSGVSYNDVVTRMTGQFLFWLQEYKKQVFVVATANDISLLPPELLRKGRFDELFFVDLPTKAERRSILRLYLKKYLELDFSGLFVDRIVELTDGFSGADLEATVRNLTYRKIADKDFALSEENVLEAFYNCIPLSRINPEKIEAIRKWGREHTISASGEPIG